ncbi:Phosphatidylethanolamine-binding protein 1, partial [Coemansia sp. RSA 638]
LLSINDTQEEPIIEFDAPPGSMFTVAIVDIDSLSNSRHGYRSYRHFLMSNLGLYDDYRGEKLMVYCAPQPSFASGAHRIAVFVLKQTAYMEFTPQDVPRSRVRFDAVEWGAHYHMTPVVASYFIVQRKHALNFV